MYLSYPKYLIITLLAITLIFIAAVALAANYCPNCGTKVQPGVNFCPKCGTSLNSSGQGSTSKSTSLQGTVIFEWLYIMKRVVDPPSIRLIGSEKEYWSRCCPSYDRDKGEGSKSGEERIEAKPGIYKVLVNYTKTHGAHSVMECGQVVVPERNTVRLRLVMDGSHFSIYGNYWTFELLVNGSSHQKWKVGSRFISD